MKKATTLPDELARLLLLETDEDVKTEDDSPSLAYRRDIRSILTALYERAPYIYAPVSYTHLLSAASGCASTASIRDFSIAGERKPSPAPSRTYFP